MKFNIILIIISFLAYNNSFADTSGGTGITGLNNQNGSLTSSVTGGSYYSGNNQSFLSSGSSSSGFISMHTEPGVVKLSQGLTVEGSLVDAVTIGAEFNKQRLGVYWIEPDDSSENSALNWVRLEDGVEGTSQIDMNEALIDFSSLLADDYVPETPSTNALAEVALEWAKLHTNDDEAYDHLDYITQQLKGNRYMKVFVKELENKALQFEMISTINEK